MTRPYNFSAGPAAIPDAVLIQAASEMLDWHGSGMGVMEMSHRGKEFMSIYEEAEADLRELLIIIVCCFCRVGRICSFLWCRSTYCATTPARIM